MHGVLDRFPDLATVALVPLGVSRFSNEAAMRPHTRRSSTQSSTPSTAGSRCSSRLWAGGWCSPPTSTTSSPTVRFPTPTRTKDSPSTRTASAWRLRSRRNGRARANRSARPAASSGRSTVHRRRGTGRCGPRARPDASPFSLAASAPVCVVTGEYGARVLEPLVGDRARILAVRNDFFGGNIAVAGLLVGADLAKALRRAARRPPLPDPGLMPHRGTVPRWPHSGGSAEAGRDRSCRRRIAAASSRGGGMTARTRSSRSSAAPTSASRPS